MWCQIQPVLVIKTVFDINALLRVRAIWRRVSFCLNTCHLEVSRADITVLVAWALEKERRQNITDPLRDEPEALHNSNFSAVLLFRADPLRSSRMLL